MRDKTTSVNTILFDLDGTLLPMDNDVFTKGYFKLLAGKLAPHGYDPQELVGAVWKGTEAMVKNDGSQTNHDVFWKTFAAIFGNKVYDDIKIFDDFYENEFIKAKAFCGYEPKASEIVKACKQKGYRLALASNPIFPMTAQIERLECAGISPDRFDYISSYENSFFCKPNPDYYTAIAKQLGAAPEECLMIGNDVLEDMSAKTVGMSVFLLTDNIINRGGKDIFMYSHGGFDALLDYMQRNI